MNIIVKLSKWTSKVSNVIDGWRVKRALKLIWQPRKYEDVDQGVSLLVNMAAKGSAVAFVELMRARKLDLHFPDLTEAEIDRFLSSVALSGDSDAALMLAEKRLSGSRTGVFEALALVKGHSPRANDIRRSLQEGPW